MSDNEKKDECSNNPERIPELKDLLQNLEQVDLTPPPTLEFYQSARDRVITCRDAVIDTIESDANKILEQINAKLQKHLLTQSHKAADLRALIKQTKQQLSALENEEDDDVDEDNKTALTQLLENSKTFLAKCADTPNTEDDRKVDDLLPNLGELAKVQKSVDELLTMKESLLMGTEDVEPVCDPDYKSLEEVSDIKVFNYGSNYFRQLSPAIDGENILIYQGDMQCPLKVSLNLKKVIKDDDDDTNYDGYIHSMVSLTPERHVVISKRTRRVKVMNSEFTRITTLFGVPCRCFNFKSEECEDGMHYVPQGLCRKDENTFIMSEALEDVDKTRFREISLTFVNENAVYSSKILCEVPILSNSLNLPLSKDGRTIYFHDKYETFYTADLKTSAMHTIKISKDEIEGPNITSFGVDSQGNLLIGDFKKGNVYLIKDGKYDSKIIEKLGDTVSGIDIRDGKLIVVYGDNVKVYK